MTNVQAMARPAQTYRALDGRGEGILPLSAHRHCDRRGVFHRAGTVASGACSFIGG